MYLIISMSLLKGLLLEAKPIPGFLLVVCPSKQFYHWKWILKFSNPRCSQKGAGETCEFWSLIKRTFVCLCYTSVLAFRHSRHCRHFGSVSVAQWDACSMPEACSNDLGCKHFVSFGSPFTWGALEQLWVFSCCSPLSDTLRYYACKNHENIVIIKHLLFYT